MKSFPQAVSESTCQKRITVCEIYNKQGELLSRESNRCSPQGGQCARLGVVQQKGNYDVNSTCNWTHAEINAINALPKYSQPYLAIIYGHSFYCDNCEQSLRKAGCEVLLVEERMIER